MKEIWSTPWKIFLCVGLPAGLFLVIWLPPFQAPDELAHFLRSYHLSEGHLLAEQTNSRIGGKLPANLANPAFDPFWKSPFHAARGITFQEIGKARQVAAAPGKRRFFDFPTAAVTSTPLVYIPQALGILGARIANLGVIDTLYTGRFVNLLVWLALACTAIRLMPLQQWTMATVALSPVSLLQACSLSSDASVIGIAFLFTACVVRFTWLPGCRMTTARFVALSAVAMCVALSKLPYAILILLLPGIFLRGDLLTRAEKRRTISIMGFAALAFAGWAFYANSTYLDYAHYDAAARSGLPLNPGADPHGQLRYMLGAPLTFIKAAAATLTQPHIYYSTFGWLGWDMISPLHTGWFIAIFAAILAIAEGNEEIGLTWRQRLCVLAAIGAVVGAIFALLYMQWNQIGAKIIAGVHGRYFLPLLPAALLAISRRARGIPDTVKLFIPIFWLGMVASTVLTIAWRYYLH